VTREQRDALSALAARYLRGELTPKEFWVELGGVVDPGKSPELVELVEALFLDCHPAVRQWYLQRPLDQRRWERYRKSLAYLRSDLPERTLRDFPSPPNDPWNASDSLFWLLLAVLGIAAYLLGLTFGVWSYLATCVSIAGVLGLAALNSEYNFKRRLAAPSKAMQAWDQKRDLWPFADEVEWQRYAPLVDELRLPSWEEYEPFTKRADFQPPEEPPRSRIVGIVQFLFLALFVIGCMPLVLAVIGLAAVDGLRYGNSPPR